MERLVVPIGGNQKCKHSQVLPRNHSLNVHSVATLAPPQKKTDTNKQRKKERNKQTINYNWDTSIHNLRNWHATMSTISFSSQLDEEWVIKNHSTWLADHQSTNCMPWAKRNGGKLLFSLPPFPPKKGDDKNATLLYKMRHALIGGCDEIWYYSCCNNCSTISSLLLMTDP